MTQKHKVSILLLLHLFLSTVQVHAQELTCEAGPVKRQYGSTYWLVYACDDNESLAVVAAPENPASPFYFFFSRAEDGGYTVRGMNTEKSDVINSALKDLKKLSKDAIQLLIKEAKNA